MVGLRTCFFGGRKESLDISSLFAQLLPSQKIVLNDISAKLVTQRQKQFLSIVIGYLKCLLNYAFSVNPFDYLCCPFIIVFYILFFLLTLLEGQPQEVPCHPAPIFKSHVCLVF